MSPTNAIGPRSWQLQGPKPRRSAKSDDQWKADAMAASTSLRPPRKVETPDALNAGSMARRSRAGGAGRRQSADPQRPKAAGQNEPTAVHKHGKFPNTAGHHGDAESEQDRLVRRSRRDKRWQLLAGLRKISKLKGCRECGLPVGRSHVGVVLNGDVAHYRGIVSCANIHCCPRCAPKIRADRCQDAMRAMDIHAERGGGFVFLTQTIPHHVAHDLKTLLDLQRDAWEALCNSRAFKRWRERVGYVGRITSLEVTCNHDDAGGWHPHKHVMLFTERPLSLDEVMAWEAELHAVYNRYLAKRGWKASAVHIGIRMDFVAEPQNTEALGQYITKMQGAYELTRADLKMSRGVHGLMPFDLLERAINGDEQAKARWHEFELAMKGRSAVRFSPGLRDHLGMGKAKTDQEIAEEETGGELELSFTAEMFRKVIADGKATAVLDQAERSGCRGVLILLRCRYGTALEAVETPGIGLLVGIRSGGRDGEECARAPGAA